MAFFDELGKKITGAAQSVQYKTRDGFEVTKIAGEVRGIKGEIEKLYTALGELFYKTEGKAASGELGALCENIAQLEEKMNALSDRRDGLLRQGRCGECGTVVKAGTNFCPNCGAKVEVKEIERPKKDEGEVCASCGKPRRPGIRFCTYCGKPFDAEEPSFVTMTEEAGEEPEDTQE